MKVLVLGGDGYLGWPTAMHFSARGHDVVIIDNMVKRFWEAEAGVEPLVPTHTLHRRTAKWKAISGKEIGFVVADIAANPRALYKTLDAFRPEAIVHYAEQPSAPFSMMDRDKCVVTQTNNIAGTLNLMFGVRHACPDAHIVKLGTMGEYGTPNIDIEEGWLEVEHKGRRDRMLFPKKPGSFYHLSKVADSHNLEFACRAWGMRVTDLNQGVVYGTDTNETRLDPDLCTSFHYDAIFGTVLNRFVVQAVAGEPMTVYGKGGQTRGFLDIRDTLRCVELAVLNPADQGEFRVFNQFTEQFSVQQLAEKVTEVGRRLGLKPEIAHIENPRVEQEQHYYNAAHSRLLDLGLQPHLLGEDTIAGMIEHVKLHRDRIFPGFFKPDVRWNQRAGS
jgi:UDP-sulfoquinovose synthase